MTDTQLIDALVDLHNERAFNAEEELGYALATLNLIAARQLSVDTVRKALNDERTAPVRRVLQMTLSAYVGHCLHNHTIN